LAGVAWNCPARHITQEKVKAETAFKATAINLLKAAGRIDPAAA